MEARSFGKFFLGVASFIAQSPQRGAESRLNGTDGHTSVLICDHYESTHDECDNGPGTVTKEVPDDE
jgi:hypothetical protein